MVDDNKHKSLKQLNIIAYLFMNELVILAYHEHYGMPGMASAQLLGRVCCYDWMCFVP